LSIQRREELLEARPMKEAIAGEGEEVREDTKGRKSDVEYSRLLSEQNGRGTLGDFNPFVGGVMVRFLSSFSHRFFTLSSRPGARLMNEQHTRR
jgi:hypothetical protein